MTLCSAVPTKDAFKRFQETIAMKTTRTYLLAGLTILLGILSCLGWLYIGQTDDAPGAGMIGFAALLSSLVVAYRVARNAPIKR